jgi:hypothetical protein
MEKIAQVRKGDYFYTSWGYDQTNIDYLVIIAISPSGKTATCRMARPINIGSQGTEDILMPGEPYGELFRMKIPYISSMPTAKRLDSFLPCKMGDTHGQTMPEYGH